MPTFTIIKADTGGFVGHSSVHPEMLALAADEVAGAARSGLVIDGQVASCGDDVSLIMIHGRGDDSPEIHGFAWQLFQKTTTLARRLGLYGAGQDLLSDAFSGNLRGMGPGYAELEFDERPSEPVICFLADKTEPRAWNLPLYKMFADPSFDRAGEQANAAMDYLRRHGPFEPHRLPLEDLEYTTMSTLERGLADRWEPLPGARPMVAGHA